MVSYRAELQLRAYGGLARRNVFSCAAMGRYALSRINNYTSGARFCTNALSNFTTFMLRVRAAARQAKDFSATPARMVDKLKKI